MAWVYILRGSCGRYYIGSTENLDRRLAERHRGKVHSTHPFGQPLELVTAKEMPARLSDLSLFLSVGKEPWLKGLHKLNWQTFFRVCTQEMDDLSQKAIKLVIEYCLEVLEEVEETIRGKASLPRLEAALNAQYAEKYENKAFQYRWALRHPVVNEADSQTNRETAARSSSRSTQDQPER